MLPTLVTKRLQANDRGQRAPRTPPNKRGYNAKVRLILHVVNNSWARVSFQGAPFRFLSWMEEKPRDVLNNASCKRMFNLTYILHSRSDPIPTPLPPTFQGLPPDLLYNQKWQQSKTSVLYVVRVVWVLLVVCLKRDLRVKGENWSSGFSQIP